MKNLFDPAAAADIRTRIGRLGPDSHPLWGRMTVTQAVEHCARGMEMVFGDLRPPRIFVGYLFGGAIKRLVLRDDEPMRRNAPTAPSLRVSGESDLEAQRARLLGLVDRFAAGGPEACTDHPHAFFGRLTPDEWAILAYKHLDHHLRQFGA